MQDLPHHYVVTASARGKDNVVLSSANLPDLATAGPPEFGGPGDVWSPESLLVAAVADWLTLKCETAGELDKVEKFTQFVGFTVKAELTIPNEKDRKKAATILEKAEKYCLITNSMKAESELEAVVRVDQLQVPAQG